VLETGVTILFHSGKSKDNGKKKNKQKKENGKNWTLKQQPCKNIT